MSIPTDGRGGLQGTEELPGVEAYRLWGTRSLACVYRWSIPGGWLEYTPSRVSIPTNGRGGGCRELGSCLVWVPVPAWCEEPGHLVEYTTEVYQVTGFSIPLEYTRWLARVSPWVSISSYYYQQTSVDRAAGYWEAGRCGDLPGVGNPVTCSSIPL